MIVHKCTPNWNVMVIRIGTDFLQVLPDNIKINIITISFHVVHVNEGDAPFINSINN